MRLSLNTKLRQGKMYLGLVIGVLDIINEKNFYLSCVFETSCMTNFIIATFLYIWFVPYYILPILLYQYPSMLVYLPNYTKKLYTQISSPDIILIVIWNSKHCCLLICRYFMATVLKRILYSIYEGIYFAFKYFNLEK